MQNNPLLEKTELPLFSKFKVKYITPALDYLLQEDRANREKLLSTTKNYTWDNLIAKMEEQEDNLSQMFSPVSHLNAVKNTPELREVYQKSITKLADYHTEVGQDRNLFKAYKKISKDKTLDNAQQKAVDDALKSFRNSGVDLQKKERAQFKSLIAELAQLQNNFENNVLDATMGWEYHIEDEIKLAGLAEHFIHAAKNKAKEQGKDGYILGLDMPTYQAIIMTAVNRDLREKFYYEFTTRASNQGSNANKWDNSTNIAEILKLRYQKAKLLGFANYSELSVDTKMVGSTKQVLTFLYDLLEKSRKQAKKELKILEAFAEEHGLNDKLNPWDIAFYSEKMKKELFDFTQEELRSYFPVDSVLQGLFLTLQKLYGFVVDEFTEFEKYDDDVMLFEVYDHDKQLRGLLYLDLYARDNKRGGAWMEECKAYYKKQDGSTQLPIAYVVCNFTHACEDETPTLTHNDVLTLFHEFGHALHHILSKVDYLSVSGINGVEWDAVELPSQFMENFCWSKEGLQLISCHIETSEPLPKNLFDKLIVSRKFQSAMAMLRQLEFALYDFKLHLLDPNKIEDIANITLDEVRQEVAVILPPDYNRFQNSFSHIFAGGYAAGYYSYKWAEVLSSDIFAEFEDSGNIYNNELGLEFMKKILEKGGSEPADVLFENFVGRMPQIDALLRHSGIGKIKK